MPASRLYVLCGHAHHATALAQRQEFLVSADEEGWVYLWAADGSVRLLRAPDLRRSRPWTDQPPPCRPGVDGLAWVGDHLVVALWWDRLEVWDVPSGRRVRSLRGLGGRLAADGDGIWAWTPERQTPGRPGAIAGGEEIPTWTRDLVRVDPATGRRTHRVTLDPPPRRSHVGVAPVVHPGLRRVAGITEGELRLWDLDTGRSVVQLAVPDRSRPDVVLSPDGAWAAFNPHGEVWTANLGSGALAPLPGVPRIDGTCAPPSGEPNPFAATLQLTRTGVAVLEPALVHASAAFSGPTAAWSPPPRQPDRAPFPTTDAAVVALAMTPDAVVSAHGDGAVRTWCLVTGALLRTLRPALGRIVGLDPDGRRVVTSGDDATWVWDDAGRVLLELPVGWDIQHRWRLAGSTLAMTRAWRGDTARAWDVATGALRLDLARHRFIGIALDPTGARLALTGSPLGERVVTGRTRQAPQGPDDIVVVSLDDPEDRVVVRPGMSRDRGAASDLRRRVRATPPDGCELTFSHDGRRLLVGGQQRRVEAWDLVDGTSRSVLIGPDGLKVAFAGDHLVAASTYASDIVVHDPAAATSLALRGHRGHVRALAGSADGAFAASGGVDGAVCLWNPATGRHVLTWQVLPGGDGWIAHTRQAWIGSDDAARFLQRGVPAVGSVPPPDPPSVLRAIGHGDTAQTGRPRRRRADRT